MPTTEHPARDTWSPEAAERIIDESVITPRVLDEAAFGAFAGRLQELIHLAVRKGQSLRDATADAQRFGDESRRSETELRKKLELAAKLMAGLDERTRRIEAAAARTEDLDALGERLDAIASERSEAAERRFRETVERYDARIRERTAAIEALEARAAEAESRLVAAEAQLDQRIAETDERCETMVAKAERARAVLDEHLGEVLERVDRQAGELQAIAEPIRAMVTRAFEALGIDPDRPSTGTKLDEMAERTAALAERLDASERNFRSLAGLAEEARGSFDKTILDAAAKMDELEARCAALAGPVAEQAKGLAQLTPELIESAGAAASEARTLQQELAATEDRIDRARAALSNHAGQMEALTHGSLRQINERVEQAGAWLAGLIRRAERVAKGLDAGEPPVMAPRSDVSASSVAEPKGLGPEPMPEPKPDPRPDHRPAHTPARTTRPGSSSAPPGASVPSPIAPEPPRSTPETSPKRSDASRVAAASAQRAITELVRSPAEDAAVAVLDTVLAEPKPEIRPEAVPEAEASTQDTIALPETPTPETPTPTIRPLDEPLDATELAGPVTPVRAPRPEGDASAAGSRPSPLLNRIADDHKIRFDRG